MINGGGLRQNGREWGGLVQRRQRNAVFSQIDKAECGEFGRVVVLAMCVQDVVVAAERGVVAANVVVVVVVVVVVGASAVVRLQGLLFGAGAV